MTIKIKYLEQKEIPELYEILSQEEIFSNLLANPYVITETNLASYLLATDPSTIAQAYSIYLNETLVGVITINNISLLKKSAYLGVLAIDQRRHDKKVTGLCVKAAKWAIRYVFETLGLNRVYAHTWSDNEKMDAVYKRVGATHEGTEREHTWKQGSFVDMKIWAILRKDWDNGE